MRDTWISPMSALTVIGYSLRVVFRNPPFRWSGSLISWSAVFGWQPGSSAAKILC
jgi:hypothetical protein